MTWLLTGGAGYIGGHVAAAMSAAGLPVVVLDDLSSGSVSRVPPEAVFVPGSVLDFDLVLATIRRHSVRGVVHLAAKKSAGESVERPLYYYRQNLGGFEVVLRAMEAAGVARMLLSSSGAVYGDPDVAQVGEATPLRPVSPYGETKAACEWLVRSAYRAFGLRYVALRYFNVVGAARRELADSSAQNLVPLIFEAISAGRPPVVFGEDYPTRDGTCIRDYVDVRDLAAAHVAAVRELESGSADCAEAYNVGRGEGYTVKEVLAAVDRVTGREHGYRVADRRAGDPVGYYAAVEKIEKRLGWRAEHDLDEMVASAWAVWPSRRPTS